MKALHSLKSTHWVTWSSPLLLLVLVFTLTTAHPNRSDAPSPRPTTTSTTSTTTTFPTTKSPRTPSTVTKRPLPHPTTTSTTPTLPVETTRVAVSSNVTASTDVAAAKIPAATETGGAFSGQLDHGDPVAVVPLVGPRTWTLVNSAPLSATLACPNSTVTVGSSVVVAGGERCQLVLSTPEATAVITWQLTPVT